MARLTLVFAAVLIALGLGSYFGLQAADSRSVTALIPAFFGVLFGLLGLLALKEGLRKHAMHVVVVLALVVMGGTGGSLGKLPAALEARSQTPETATSAEPPSEADVAAAVEQATGGATDGDGDEDPIRPNAVIVQAITFGLSAAFFVACVMSFVRARRASTAPTG